MGDFNVFRMDVMSAEQTKEFYDLLFDMYFFSGFMLTDSMIDVVSRLCVARPLPLDDDGMKRYAKILSDMLDREDDLPRVNIAMKLAESFGFDDVATAAAAILIRNKFHGKD